MDVTTAEKFIRDSFADIIPDGAPLPFIDMTDIKHSGRKYTATLTMWDGKKAILCLMDTPFKSFSWLEWEGGDITFEDGTWARVPKERVTDDSRN